VTKNIPISVSEFFPDKFWAAVRQKSRWIIGISLQGWTALAWKGSLARKYFFLRDRKGLIVNFVSLMAYVLVVLFLLTWTGEAIFAWPPFPHAFPTWLLWANGVLLVNRLLQRMFFVWRLYSWRQALLVIPRVVVCNFINFFATLRAASRYTASLISGKPLTWEKTDHMFPSMEQLAKTRKLMGDLLIERKAIDAGLLQRALALKETKEMSLGRLLVEGECISEAQLAEAICKQTGYPRAQMENEAIDLPEDFFPPSLAAQYRVFPLRIDHLGKLRLAVTGSLSPAVRAEIRKITDLDLSPVVASDDEMDRLLQTIGITPEIYSLTMEEKLCAPRF
jgi:adsorption protein B